MVTVIAETSGNSLHPVTAQLVGAAGGDATVLCAGGVGAAEAAALSGVAKVISVEGDFHEVPDGVVTDALRVAHEGIIELIDLQDSDIGKINIKKPLPGKKIKSIEVLVKVANNK